MGGEWEGWAAQQVALFHDRVEMLVCAFIAKFEERPILIIDDDECAKRCGQQVAMVDPHLVADDGEGVAPRLAELSASRAVEWRARYVFEPEEAVIYIRVYPGQISVVVDRKSLSLIIELERMKAFGEAGRHVSRKGRFE